jgi:hypothetical protein
MSIVLNVQYPIKQLIWTGVFVNTLVGMQSIAEPAQTFPLPEAL